jgi:hypothetical protein
MSYKIKIRFDRNERRCIIKYFEIKNTFFIHVLFIGRRNVFNYNFCSVSL